MVERCPTCKRRMKRSSEANRRYWALLHAISEKTGHGVESLHLWAKSKWLGCTDYKLPTGAVIAIPNSSADLDPGPFNDYMTQVEVWANEQGIYLQDMEA